MRERIGADSEEIEVPATVLTASDLIDWLAGRGEQFAFLADQKLVVRVAADQQLIGLHDELGEACEIAIFPPMTGG
ncbi:MAG: MoaD/ThiS family protein [Pseudomonadota bacterium]